MTRPRCCVFLPVLLMLSCLGPRPTTFDAGLNTFLAASKITYQQLEKSIGERINAGRVTPEEARAYLDLTEKYEQTHARVVVLAAEYIDIRDLLEAADGTSLEVTAAVLQAVQAEIEAEKIAMGRVVGSLRGVLDAAGEL